MKCEEVRVDLRTVLHSAQRQRSAQLLFQLNTRCRFRRNITRFSGNCWVTILARAALSRRR